MSPKLYEKTDIICCRLGIQEYYEQSCFRYEPTAMLIPPS